MQINNACFGEFYIRKINEYAYTLVDNPFGNFFDDLFPILYLSYMIIYMATSECGLDKIFNDYSTYCWYKGCWPMQFLYKSGDKFLYILRALNDAAIVWREGIEEFQKNPNKSYEQEEPEWGRLTAQTAMTLADIF